MNLMRILIVFLLFLGQSLAALAEECQPQNPQNLVKINIERAADGDSVRLSSRHEGSKELRIIGINAPENGEKYANKARSSLTKALKHKQAYAEPDNEKKDGYNRVLAHIWIKEGESWHNPAKELLTQGLGFYVTIAPNIKHIDCYVAAENAARQAKKGLWRDNYKSYLHSASAGRIAAGFGFIQGKIHKIIRKGKSGYELVFEGDRASLWIASSSYAYFGGEEKISSFKDKTVSARGWIYKRKGRYQITLSHPSMLSDVLK